MKTFIARTVLALVLGAMVSLAVAAKASQERNGYIRQIEPASRSMVVGKQIYMLASTVNIHGLPKRFALTSDLQPGMNIRFRLEYNPRTQRQDLVKEIWVIPE